MSKPSAPRSSPSKSSQPPATPSPPRLVGRAKESAALASALDAGARLVTVTGAFGMGKTALVREAVRAGLTRGGEALPVTRVDLSEAATEGALLDAVAHALGHDVRGARKGGAPLAAGMRALVLDPFDRLTSARDTLLRWLDAEPELSLVVVSRERLSVPDEELVELAPLSTADGATMLEMLGAHHRGTFAPTASERAALARVVERLDGIPLAIELAAPRLAVMGPEALLLRLENRWDLLRRSGGATDRHATLETSLGWSLELLDPGARDVLASLTIFHGGFTADAVEAIVAPPAGTDVLDALQGLRARSLVRAEQDEVTAELRLSLLSSVRGLARRELTPARIADLTERHATYYVALAEREARAAEDRGSTVARARLGLERDNLLAIAAGILGDGVVSASAADRAMRALCAIGPALLAGGASEELARNLELGLSVAQGSGADPRLIARAMLLRADVRALRGDVVGADRDLAEAMVLAHHARDESVEARALLAAATSAIGMRESSRARAAVARARELAGTLDPAVVARALRLEGACAELAGDPIGARLAYEESLARSRALDLPYAEVEAGLALALLDLREGALDAMGARIAAARPVAARHAHVRAEVVLLGLSAVHAQLRGELAHALAEHEDAARRAREARTDNELPWLAGLAAIARAEAAERGEARAGLEEARAGERALDPDFALVFSIARARLARSAGRTAEEELERTRARPTFSVARDRGLVMFAETGAAPDTRSGLVALAARVPSAPPTSAFPPPDDAAVLRVGPGGAWFRPPGGERVDLSRRKPLRLLLERLASERERGTRGLTWDTLLEAGWPGEKMRADAGAHRVRVAISTLRKLGLADVLRTDESGYALSADVALERTAR